MNLRRTDGLTTVTLSRRNLEGLLEQLNAGGPLPAMILRQVDGAGLVYVVAEEDEAHYGDRTPGVSAPSQELS